MSKTKENTVILTAPITRGKTKITEVAITSVLKQAEIGRASCRERVFRAV